jgi:hypothetical protein
VPGLQQGLKVILISVETPDHSQGGVCHSVS